MASAPRTPRARDAERSRQAILGAAEELFAERGFDRVSLGEIGAAAGLSRGTPSYFFGSKDQLYVAVLERVFAEREFATNQAFAPLFDWIDAPSGPLEIALRAAVGGYLNFLLERPTFVRLIQREDLSSGRHLRATPRESQAISSAFEALHAIGSSRHLSSFRVDDAVLLFVSLTFSPLTQRSTFMVAIDRDLADPVTRRRHVGFVVDQLLHLVTGP